MIFDYYFVVVALTVLASGVLVALIADNNRFAKDKKVLCIISTTLLILAALAEYISVLLNGAPEETRTIHIILKVFELSVSPVMVFYLIWAFNGFKRSKKIIPVAIINLVLQVYSGFSGFLYYFDGDNVYHHNTFYWLYTAVYAICGVMFFRECIRFSKHYQNRNFTSLLSILIFLAAGLSIHIIFGELRADWLTVAIASSLFYNYYNSLADQTDSLTQLLDRKSYDTHIASLNKKATIIMFDVDHFKAVNDTHGHDAGDNCLRAVAVAILRSYTRYGYCYRIGGDEFCVVTRKAADIMALNRSFYDELEKLRQTPDLILPNVSLGYSEFNPRNGAIQDAVKVADTAMYQVKKMRDDRKSTETEEKLMVPELHTIPYPEKYKNRIRSDGASAFDGIANHTNSRYYLFNDYYNMESDETLHILPHFETYQQTTEFTCGAACALMVLNWFGAKKYHEMVVGRLIESKPNTGSTTETIADFFDLIGWNVEHHADTDLRFDTAESFESSVIGYIDRGIPIMVDWVDWEGHWQVIIGIDTCGSDMPYDDVLIFADPYDVTDHYQDGYYIFPLSRFFGMWQEGSCAKKEAPYKQPFVVAYPKEKEEKE